MIVAGPEGFRKKDYRKFNIRSTELTPGDDFAMMREVLERRFKRLMNEAPPQPIPPVDPAMALTPPIALPVEEGDESPWPDLVLIDGGLGQLNAAREVLAGLGAEVPLVAIAKGQDRDAGRETFFLPAATRSSCRRAIRCSISSSGCAMRPIVSPSAHTGHVAPAICARPACRRSPASDRRANARCCMTSARSKPSSAPRSPT